MPLPDCPHYHSPQLKAEGVPLRGWQLCVCNGCARSCRVSGERAVIHWPESMLDTGGNVVYADP